MWANAQRDGRPAEHRWRPLFNAAKFGWRPLLKCRAVTLPRRETRWNVLGFPQTTGPISDTSGPKFTILWGCLEEILLLNKFFSECLYVPWLRRYSPTKFYDGAQMPNFWRSFASCIFQRAACCTFQTCILNSHSGHTMCGSMVDIQSPTAEIRRGKKEGERKKEETTGQKYYGLPYSIGRP